MGMMAEEIRMSYLRTDSFDSKVRDYFEDRSKQANESKLRQALQRVESLQASGLAKTTSATARAVDADRYVPSIRDSQQDAESATYEQSLKSAYTRASAAADPANQPQRPLNLLG